LPALDDTRLRRAKTAWQASPDPAYRDGRPAEEHLSKYGINTRSPAFLSAAKACGGE